MSIKCQLWCITAAAMAVLISPSVLATTNVLTIHATDRGWYDSFGNHDAENTNYGVGNIPIGPTTTRNFFVFDVFTVDEIIISAELHLLNPAGGFVSIDPTENYRLSKVTTDPFLLMMGGANLTDIYDDLASEPIYGNYLASPADNNSTVVIPLTAAAVADLNSANQFWSVGGSISTLDSDPQSREIFFANSGGNPGGDMSQTQLVLTVIPAPGALLPLLAGALLPIRRRRVE